MLATRQKFTYSQVLANAEKSKPLQPKTFFDKWIPLIYGVLPGEKKFRLACLDLVLEKGIIGLKWKGTNISTAYHTWTWEDGQKAKYPSDLESLLGAFDFILNIYQVTQNLPRYSIDDLETPRK